jgi:hypothetical protein
MGVSSTTYWTRIGKFLLKTKEVWGMVSSGGVGGGVEFTKFASKM